jgi:hypothetical protein
LLGLNGEVKLSKWFNFCSTHSVTNSI